MPDGISPAAILQIILIDIVLSGDNAVVIAMASRSLPAALQKKAIFWGGAGAIVLRVLITAVVAYMLMVPLLQLVGGLFLLYVAFKLLVGSEAEAHVKAGTSLREAITTIILADLVMSLDNMLAVGGASHGSLGLLLAGLLLSMAIIMFFSSVIANLMNRFSWLVYIGAGILSWTAAEMIMADRWLNAHLYAPTHSVRVGLGAAITVGVLLSGFAANRRMAVHRPR